MSADLSKQTSAPGIESVPPAGIGNENGRSRKYQNLLLFVLSLLLVVSILGNIAGLFYYTYVLPMQIKLGQAGGTGDRTGAALPTDVIPVNVSDERQGFKVTVDWFQVRKSCTRVGISVVNQSTADVEFMAGAKAVLVDDKGDTYLVDPLGGEHDFFGTVPVSGKMEGYLEFDPIAADAKSLTLMIPRVFSLKQMPWTVEITWDVK